MSAVYRFSEQKHFYLNFICVRKLSEEKKKQVLHQKHVKCDGKFKLWKEKHRSFYKRKQNKIR